MESTMHNDVSPAFDGDGFLGDPAAWNEGLAEQIARADGIGALSDGHWLVINTLRQHYFQCGALTPVRHVCHTNRLERRCVEGLFRGMREAWRVAGLPNPGEEAKSYM